MTFGNDENTFMDNDDSMQDNPIESKTNRLTLFKKSLERFRYNGDESHNLEHSFISSNSTSISNSNIRQHHHPLEPSIAHSTSATNLNKRKANDDNDDNNTILSSSRNAVSVPPPTEKRVVSEANDVIHYYA